MDDTFFKTHKTDII